MLGKLTNNAENQDAYPCNNTIRRLRVQLEAFASEFARIIAAAFIIAQIFTCCLNLKPFWARQIGF
jgi:hypothetical protein